MSAEWTVETLLAHLIVILDERDLRYQQRYDAQQSAIGAALQSAQEAVLKAEVATEKRFESVNEFRGTLSDQAATFISRNEIETLRAANDDRVADLTERLDRMEGRDAGVGARIASIRGSMAIYVGLATLVLGLAVFVANIVTK